MPKLVFSLALASLIVFPLAACSAPAASGCEPTPSGSSSEAVEVAGSLGVEPSVTLPDRPFEVEGTQRSVAISGDGALASEGDVASVMYGAYNATSGETLEIAQGSTWLAAEFLLEKGRSYPGIYSSLHCSHVGDRVVSVVPPSELFEWSGEDMSAAGISSTDTVVFVFDVLAVAPAPTATPEPQGDPGPLPSPAAWTSGVPEVDLSGSMPHVSLPEGPAPKDLLLAVLEPGAGEAVTLDSTVTLDYQGTSWNSREIFDQSYGAGTPATFPVGGVIPGFAAALVGQKADATVLVTIPPEYAYGPGEVNEQNLVGQSLLFVIHIISVQ